MSKMNQKVWGSSNHGKQTTEDQNKKGKKWFITTAPKRTKERWNKKDSIREVSKKGSRDLFVWAD